MRLYRQDLGSPDVVPNVFGVLFDSDCMVIKLLAAAVLFVISFCKQCLAVKLTLQHKYSRCVLSVPHGGEIRLNKPNT